MRRHPQVGVGLEVEVGVGREVDQVVPRRLGRRRARAGVGDRVGDVERLALHHVARIASVLMAVTRRSGGGARVTGIATVAQLVGFVLVLGYVAAAQAADRQGTRS